MMDHDTERWARLNLPHARTVLQRVGRSLEALGAFGEAGDGHAAPLAAAFDEDPPAEEALRSADAAAALARALVAAILATPFRGDRLGLHVRNLFECLGLAEEGALQSLACGERPDSPLR